MLFDEPLTVIDPHLKWQLRRKLKQIHQRAQAHADLRHARPGRGADLRRAGGGDDARPRRCRSAAPQELFERPQHTFVGHFIGSPGMNFLPVQLRRRRRRRSPAQRAALPTRHARRARAATLKLGIRPEYVTLAARRRAGRGAGDGRRRRRTSAPTSCVTARRRRRTCSRRALGPKRAVPQPATRRGCSSPARAHLLLQGRRAGRGGRAMKTVNQKRLAAGPAGGDLRGLLGDPAADDGGQLLGAGHHLARARACSSAPSGSRR